MRGCGQQGRAVLVSVPPSPQYPGHFAPKVPDLVLEAGPPGSWESMWLLEACSGDPMGHMTRPNAALCLQKPNVYP